jgi:gliding motility-associated-like protein
MLAAEASHLVGGFLTYRWLGTNGTNTQYRVTLMVYRDCAKDGTSDEVPFDPDLDLCVYTGDRKLYTTYKIKLLTKRKVQPVGNTNCPQVASACLEQGIYETTISLPNSSTGYHLKWERCCRNTQNNLRDQGGIAYQGQTYYGYIPPTNIKNSSPYFQDIPVPFICKDDTTTIRNRAVDPDGDSLSYKLVTPWQGADGNNPTLNTCPNPMSVFPEVEYRNGFSAQNPFGTSGIASIDAFNGLTTYLSRISGRFAVAIEVTEWRNGIAISTVRLDLQILVINCPQNNKPILEYEGGSRIWQLEAGEKKCWEVKGVDNIDKDQIITLKAYGDILTGSTTYDGTKATLSPEQNANRGEVKSTFCWQPDCNTNTKDTFRVTFETYDDGCPSKFTNENVLIKVNAPSFQETINGPRTLCQNESGVTYTVNNRNFNNQIKWTVINGTIVGSDTGNSIVVNWGNTTSGRVEIIPISRFGCPGTPKVIPISLIPAPDRPEINGTDTTCVGSGYRYRYAAMTFNSSLTYTWVWKDAIVRDSANDKRYIDLSWLFSANDTPMLILYATNAQGCRSIADTIFPVPAGSGTPQFEGPLVVCPNNNNIEYQISNFNSVNTYTWTALGANRVRPQTNGLVLVDWGNTGLGWLKVMATNRFGCRDSMVVNIAKAHDLPGQRPQGDTQFCEFTPMIPYKVNRVSGETYTWNVSGGSLVNGQSTPNITVNWGAAGSGYVGVFSTAYDTLNDKECSSREFRIPVLLHPIPAGNLFNLDVEPEQCEQNLSHRLSTNLIGNITLNDKLEWEIIPNYSLNVIRNANSGVVEHLEISLAQPGTFKIRARIISAFGCVGPWDETQITINPKPINTRIVGNDVFCFPPKGSYRYQANGESGSSFNWTISGGSFTQILPLGSAVDVKWDTAAPIRWLKMVETTEKGCLGDTLLLPVAYDNPYIRTERVTVAAPPALDDAIQYEYKVRNSPVPNGNVIIERSPTGSSNFIKVGESPQSQTVFTDASAQPDERAYDYRSFMLNRCGDTLWASAHTSIWLTGEKTSPLSMSFAFTPYFGFENGVDRYEVYRLLIGKSGYEWYRTYPSATQDSFNNGEDNFGQRYRIKAYETGTDRFSWSNDITLFFEPVYFMPNAFTPNDHGPNDVFKPVISGVKSYEFRIFNRWGEKMAEYFKEDQGWDGTYQGKPAPEGVYVYQLQFKDFQDKLYKFSGTIHLLR